MNADHEGFVFILTDTEGENSRMCYNQSKQEAYMATERPIVWVDMDGTMYDFDVAVLAHIPEDLHVERANFYITDDYPQEWRATIKNVYNAPGFFHELQLIDGVKESWQAMIDAGYDPRILSAPLRSNPLSVEGKLAALTRDMVPDFGPGILEHARFDKEKWKYDGLALFDDRPTVGVNPETGIAPWEHMPEVALSRATFRLLSWREPSEPVRLLDTIRALPERVS